MPVTFPAVLSQYIMHIIVLHFPIYNGIILHNHVPVMHSSLERPLVDTAGRVGGCGDIGAPAAVRQ